MAAVTFEQLAALLAAWADTIATAWAVHGGWTWFLWFAPAILFLEIPRYYLPLLWAVVWRALGRDRRGRRERQALLRRRPLVSVVVAGRNEELKADLQKKQAPARHRVKVMGFTDQIDELMQAADVVVSKPGGLTTSEVLARGAAMVVVNPIPGQEERNSDHLLEEGAAIRCNNLPALAYKIDRLLDDPERLAWMRANVRRLARPRAAFDVVSQVVSLDGHC